MMSWRADIIILTCIRYRYYRQPISCNTQFQLAVSKSYCIRCSAYKKVKTAICRASTIRNPLREREYSKYIKCASINLRMTALQRLKTNKSFANRLIQKQTCTQNDRVFTQDAESRLSRSLQGLTVQCKTVFSSTTRLNNPSAYIHIYAHMYPQCAPFKRIRVYKYSITLYT